MKPGLARFERATREAGVPQLRGSLDKGTVFVEMLINSGLRQVRERVIADVRMTQDGRTGEPGRGHFAPEHDDLIRYAFHQLGQIFASTTQLYECSNANCRRPFIPDHGNRTRYCENRCAEAAKKRRQRARLSV